MSNTSSTTPAGLARYAREYFEAAIAADDVIGMRPGYEFVAPPPVMFLVAHSIELAIKSYILFKGKSLNDITKLSHKLNDCWDAAKKENIEVHVKLSDDDIDVLNLINDLHVSTELRYIQTGYKNFPVFGPLQNLAKKLLDAICPLVGYK
ncbi:hypothetical protein [Desulforhopalus sp. IMCC35007]|uniref:hypothetical protein n=1 Tax=Desulforhopalus sp. IMCC35007 TaxID=2569543 RepID=UPI0010AEEB12|nr:hypothetical protein [Desulforhopalus sp. IMCC35007]TKB08403.1 hypothetical protein FCL48_13795 [Desulforhopalus sp. IMCC35007]